jgi:acetyl esterase/lipase
MKMLLRMIFSLFFAVVLGAADGKRAEIELWPNEVPGPEPKLEAERDMTKESENKIAGRRLIRLGNVSKPTITVYPAPKDKANGGAVLVCPGGGYHILALDLEGTEVCERLNEMGFTAVLLKYRVPRRPNREKHEPPLQDAQRAMSLIRQNATEWGIDPKRIGVLGFSAGGHLAAVLSTGPEDRSYPKGDAADELEFRPNFTILIYPGYLTGEKGASSELSPEFKITKQTPQAFIAMSADDSVRVENALAYAAALQKEKIPFALHIYPTGGHGYGLRQTEEPVTTWPERLAEWLKARGLGKASNEK